MALTLQTSTNLINWTTLLTVTPTNSPATMTTPTALTDVARFYRAINP